MSPKRGYADLWAASPPIEAYSIGSSKPAGPKHAGLGRPHLDRHAVANSARLADDKVVAQADRAR